METISSIMALLLLISLFIFFIIAFLRFIIVGHEINEGLKKTIKEKEEK